MKRLTEVSRTVRCNVVPIWHQSSLILTRHVFFADEDLEWERKKVCIRFSKKRLRGSFFLICLDSGWIRCKQVPRVIEWHVVIWHKSVFLSKQVPRVIEWHTVIWQSAQVALMRAACWQPTFHNLPIHIWGSLAVSYILSSLDSKIRFPR
jgi:hypothetical protein